MSGSDISFDIESMQQRQLRHDAIAHRDILALDKKRRLTHFTLHFAKYQSRLARAAESGHFEVIARNVTDSLIIAMAAGNTLGLHLAVVCNSNGTVLARDMKTLIANYGDCVGAMAKACEAFDHAEDFPSITVLKDAMETMIEVIVGMAAVARLPLTRLVSERWDEIERRLSVSARRPKSISVVA